jgi:hypothetical protein
MFKINSIHGIEKNDVKNFDCYCFDVVDYDWYLLMKENWIELSYYQVSLLMMY